jgi:dienelactone hydrolase
MLEPIHYTAGELALTGYLAKPRLRGPLPGVLVAHEAIGLNDHIKRRARQLADLGYVAFALDLYGAHDLDLAQAQVKSAEVMRTPGLLLERARAGLNVLEECPLVDRDRLAAVGFCQGGVTIMELARGGAPLKAVVGFHPGFKRPEGSVSGPISAKVLMMVGDQDPVVSEDERAGFVDEMRSTGADWEMHMFGGVGHSFTNPGIDDFGFPGFAYAPHADRRSWQMMAALLEETFSAS